MSKPVTHITDEIREQFYALISREYGNFCLLSCFCNGKPAVAICSIVWDGENYDITPLFVNVHDGLVLTDHEGNPA